MTLQLRLSGFPIQEIYRIIPLKNQFYEGILEDLEIPKNRIVFYTNSLQSGKYLLVIKTTESQVKQAGCVLSYLGINDWEFYYTPEAEDLISSNFDKVPLF
ncbi:MAG: hypothetical protein WBA39_24745 [Rivularia sp. (in: cyanobacteria)]